MPNLITQEIGKWLYFGGIALLFLGAVISHYPQLLSWFGRLPGDLRWQNEKVSISIPLASMFVISLVLTAAANLAFKLFGGAK